MSDYEVNIRAGKPRPRRRGGGRKPECTFPCAFCGGTGKDPESSLISTKPCRACKGKGTITENINCNNLIECNFCKGRGIDPDSSLISTKLCRVCKGKGKIKK